MYNYHKSLLIIIIIIIIIFKKYDSNQILYLHFNYCII